MPQSAVSEQTYHSHTVTHEGKFTRQDEASPSSSCLIEHLPACWIVPVLYGNTIRFHTCAADTWLPENDCGVHFPPISWPQSSRIGNHIPPLMPCLLKAAVGDEHTHTLPPQAFWSSVACVISAESSNNSQQQLAAGLYTAIRGHVCIDNTLGGNVLVAHARQRWNSREYNSYLPLFQQQSNLLFVYPFDGTGSGFSIESSIYNLISTSRRANPNLLLTHYILRPFRF